MVNLEIGLHYGCPESDYRSPRVVKLVMWFHHGSPMVVKLVMGLHHQKCKKVKLFMMEFHHGSAKECEASTYGEDSHTYVSQ